MVNPAAKMWPHPAAHPHWPIAYTLFYSLAYSTRAYFASCVKWITINEQNVIICQTIEWEVCYSTTKKNKILFWLLFSILFPSAGSSSSAVVAPCSSAGIRPVVNHRNTTVYYGLVFARWNNSASVNSICAPPSRADPRALDFFLPWMANSQQWGGCPVLRRHCNIFHWLCSRIVPF